MSEKIKQFFSKIWEKIAPKMVLQSDAKRVYSNIIEFKNLGKHKFHLRILKNGNGILIIDSRFVIYLNHTAMVMFQMYIEQKSIDEIATFFEKHYRVEPNIVSNDFTGMLNKLSHVLTEDDSVPIFNLGIKTKEVELNEFPFRADIALTYETPVGKPAFPSRSPNMIELNTENTKKLVDKLWDLGVPNVTFSGGEPTLRDDLLELIQYTEDKGFITGIVTDGMKFADNKYLETAIKDGLDYIQVTMHSHDESVHNSMMNRNIWAKSVEALKNIEEKDLYFMTRTTLTKKNIESIEKTIKWLRSELNVQVMAFNALINFPNGTQYKNGITKIELEKILTKIFTLADDLKIDCKFYSPNQYLVVNPIEVGTGPKMGSATRTSICIEPNGSVLPSFSYFESVGNILEDPWEKIWYSKLFKAIRENDYTEPKATEEDLLTICNGGSPLNID